MLCVTIPSISAYLTTSESKDSAFTIAKQESFDYNPDDGSTPVNGEYYNCGDYTYRYYESDNGWHASLNSKVTDTKQTSYGPILESINGKPIVNMQYTFFQCYQLTVSPVIPSGVTNMFGTFSDCYNLITAPEIPNGVTNMSGTFALCYSLTTAPIIPESVTSMWATFSGCTSLKTYVGSTDPDGDFSNYKLPNDLEYMNSAFNACTLLTAAPVVPENIDYFDSAFKDCTLLTGEIEINANPSVYYDCFKGTTNPIILKGTSTKLAELAATATNGNVTVQPEG